MTATMICCSSVNFKIKLNHRPQLKLSHLLIGSEVTQAIKMMENPDEITPIILEPLDAQNKSFIFFAINDNSSDQAGGSHWSLCIFSKPDNTFFHFDSSGYSNHFPCETLVNIMKKCLHCPKAELKKVDCLQQNNCYDCGIYVLCHADLASKTIMKSKSLAEVKKLQYKTITTKRSELIEIIKSFSSSN